MVFSKHILVVTAAIAGISVGSRSATSQTAERWAPVGVSGTVFLDRNENGSQDAGEPGLSGIAVSDQAVVVMTDDDGRFAFEAAGYGYVFITPPDGYAIRGTFWRSVGSGPRIDFPVVSQPRSSVFTFVHASDTHLDANSLPRMRRLRAMVDSLNPSFVLISGDLIRDALRVGDTVATALYQMLTEELSAFSVPVYTAPGNHEIFGIERHSSLVSPSHALYGKRMYRSFLGPNYYSFDYGGVHFVALDTVDYDDLWYYGHVDSLQLAWLTRDLESLEEDRPVVTFNHIPLASARPVMFDYQDDGVAPTLIRVGDQTHFRHAVHNASDVLELLRPRLELALGGHFHRQERLSFDTPSGEKRFYQTAAAVGPATPGTDLLGVISGFTLYRVSEGRVDDGQFIPLTP